MNQAFSRLIKIALSTLGCFCATGKISLAQVTPDGTVNTQVNQSGNISEITGGETRGSNLFHSFENFSVPTNNEAFFNNAESIGNIFSRVTGGDVSSINGAIRANGAANLFLINPAGIIFGENASLNIGGSFYGSTAESILFPDGEYSALQPESESVLTVEVPIGLGFASNPGEITNSSVVNDGFGLEVAPGNNITLVGGDVKFEQGAIFAPDGTVNLGGLSTAGIVNLNDNGSLSFPSDIARADIIFSDAADVTVVGERGGNINLYTRNAELMGGSDLDAGIIGDAILIDAQSGNITIDATDQVTIDNSFVTNVVTPEASGSAGDVTINTSSLSLANGGQVITSTFGQGNAGSIEITAKDNISIDGESSDGISSLIGSTVELGAEGDAEDISITTNSLSVTDGGQVSTNTFGQGNAGSIEINASDTISIDGESSAALPSFVSGGVAAEVSGNAGSVIIDTGSLSVTNGGEVSSNTLGRGNAGLVEITASDTISIDGERSDGIPSLIGSTLQPGAEGDAEDIRITTNSLSLTNGGQVITSTSGQGNAGSIEINASDTIAIDGENSTGLSSLVSSGVGTEASGNAKDISITTNFLSLTNGGQVSSSTFGQGNAGSIEINASDTIAIDGGSNNFLSSIGSTVNPGAVGDAENISITTNSLSLTNGGQVITSTFGQGNAGAIEITANDTIAIDGSSNNFPTGIGSTVLPGAVGDAENISITTNSLSLTNGGQVITSTFGQGNAGSIEIMANDTISIDGGSNNFRSGILSTVEPGAEGNAENISITTNSLSLTNGGQVITSTFGQGNAGVVEINASDTISIDGENSNGASSLIGSSVGLEAVGDAKDIKITTSSLSLTNGGQVNTSTFGQGNAGVVEINASDTISINESSNTSASGIFSGVESGAVGDAEDISITTNSLSVTNSGQINASTLGQGNAGSIEIMANDAISIGGSSDTSTGIFSGVESGAVGNAEDISITANSLSLTNGGQVAGGTSGKGNAGSIEINVNNTISIDGGFKDIASGIFSTVEPGAVGDAEDISITTNSLSLTNGGQVTASTFSQGNAGSIEISANDAISIDGEFPSGFPSGIFSTVVPGAVGNAKDISITANSLSLTDEGEVSVSTFGQGNAGQLAINANSLNLDFGFIEATTNSGGGNIDLRVAEDLTLKNNSLISAEAVGDADGGNLFIDAKFIVASPNQNNDLIARAEQGTGGNINIVSSGVFGLQERSSIPINSTNDIDASSELGVDGTVNLNTNNDFLNSFELIIPDFAVAKQALQGSCFARRNSQQGSFVYGGTGGLPVSPDSMIEEEESFSSRLSRVEPSLPSPNPLETSSPPTQEKWQIGDPIVEPTHLVKTKDGRLLWVNKIASRDSLFCQ